MTSRNRASDTIDTSTIAADRSLRTLKLSRRLALVALVSTMLAWLAGPTGRWLAVLPLLLFGPGYLIESTLRPFPHPRPFLRPTLWLGLSLSAVALLYEWATALGLSLTPLALGTLATLCGLGIFWRLWRQGDKATRRQGDERRSH